MKKDDKINLIIFTFIVSILFLIAVEVLLANNLALHRCRYSNDLSIVDKHLICDDNDITFRFVNGKIMINCGDD